jgi:radical SAM superfamily enzyme YgiQ (UPF0313 family)
LKVAFLQHTWDDNLGILQLCANLKANDHSCEIFLEERGWLTRVIDFAPDITAYSCTTGQHRHALQTIADLDKKAGRHIPTIMGGPHPTFFPEVIRQHVELDAICIGEGDEAIVELADQWPNWQKISNVRNLTVRLNGKIVENPLRPLVSNLDSLPFPDRSYYRQYPFFESNKTKYVLTGRGCPYDCSYCFNHCLKKMYQGLGSYVRKRSVENTIEELSTMRDRYGLERIGFSCDVFIVDRHWFTDFAREYKNKIGLPYICNVRANLIDDETARLLADSGCECASFGIESGDENLRNSLLNKKLTEQQIMNCANSLRRHNIKILSHNMVGLPGETVEQAFETVHINQKVDPDYPWCSILQFYPGTEISVKAEERQLIVADYSRTNYSFYEDSSLRQENTDELFNLQKLFFYAVKVPLLEPVIRKLIKLPPNRLFRWLFMISYGYILRGRSTVEIPRLVRLFLKTRKQVVFEKSAD